jgi:hypothetical protein
MAITRIPEQTKAFILECIEADYRTFERLKERHQEAMRDGHFAMANQIATEMGQYMQPSNPAIMIFGGPGGHIIVDEKRVPVT